MKRLFVLLIAILLVSATAIGVSALMVDSGIDYTETVETIDNPGTGSASNAWKVLGWDKLPTSFNVPTVAPCFDIGSCFSSGNDHTQSGYPSVAGGNATCTTKGENLLIDDETLAQLDAYFAAAEAQGTIVIPRFAYTWSNTVGTEPDDMEWMITHIEQLSEVINRYPRTVIAVEAGMVGPWGEMHSSKYENRTDMNKMIGAWVENLDEDIKILCRTSNHFINYVYADNQGKQSERNALFMADLKAGTNPVLKRFGMYNDGYLGNAWDYGTWGGNTMSREDGIALLKALGSDRPYGGELAYAGLDHIQGTVQGGGKAPFYYNTFAKELYDTHLSYLANIDAQSHTVVSELSKITFDESFDFDGAPDFSAYYGQTLQKFMRDHMGFRFVLREAKNDAMACTGQSITFSGKIENTGFGDILFNPVCELLIVSEWGEAESILVEPDAKAFKSTETVDYSFTVDLPNLLDGQYKAYLRMGSTSYEDAAENAFTVRFANADIWNDELRANYLGSFTYMNTEAFSDVGEGSWYEQAVYFAYNRGIMGGVAEGKFNPNGTTTRAMVVQVLYNMQQKPDVSGVITPFTDISGKWYEDAVKWAYDTGAVNGTSPTTFTPEANITREQFATILYRFSNSLGEDVSARADLSGYTDAKSVSSYAVDAMAWANANGYIGGMTANTLGPRGNATRAQMAQIMMRYTLVKPAPTPMTFPRAFKEAKLELSGMGLNMVYHRYTETPELLAEFVFVETRCHLEAVEMEYTYSDDIYYYDAAEFDEMAKELFVIDDDFIAEMRALTQGDVTVYDPSTGRYRYVHGAWGGGFAPVDDGYRQITDTEYEVYEYDFSYDYYRVFTCTYINEQVKIKSIHSVTTLPEELEKM